MYVNFKSKGAFVAACVLCAAALTIWPGCATPPLPASRKPISSLKGTDFAFPKDAHLSRLDIVSKVGEPDEYFPDLRVSCYKLNRVTRRRLVLLFGVLPIAAPRDADSLEFAMIEFDEYDKMLRLVIKINTDYPGALRYSAKRWVTKGATDPHDH